MHSAPLRNAITTGLILLLGGLLLGACDLDPREPRTSREPTFHPTSSMTPDQDGTFRVYLPVVGRQFDAKPRPRGFGVAGGGGTHQRWFYNWGYGSSNYYSNPRFLPMIWGGPPANRCNPNHPNFDPDADCSCTWRKHNEHNWASECHPGCASAATPYEPNHKPGCTQEQRLAFAQRHVDFVLQDPAKRKGRTWLLFNEPANSDQAALDPHEAASLADVFMQQMRAVDPRARFYCCGTMVHSQAKLTWMKNFSASLHEPLDGIHYHNYYPPAWHDVDQIKAMMRNFYSAMQPVTTASGQKLGRLPMLITEWAGLFPSAADHRCAGANNRDGVMRKIATWLNRQGEDYGIDGAAWFVSVSPAWASCGLYDGTGAPNCLGKEYETYVWGQVP